MVTYTHDIYLEKLKQINTDLTPTVPYAGAYTKIPHTCPNNHIYTVQPAQLLVTKRTCPYCRGSRVTEAEYLRRLAALKRSMLPVEPFITVAKPILHRCTNCGYEARLQPRFVVHNSTTGSGCYICDGPRKYDHEEFMQCLKDQGRDDLVVLTNYVNSQTKVLCRCTVCAYEWLVTPNKLINFSKGCPRCRGGRITMTAEEYTKLCLEKRIKFLSKEYTGAVSLYTYQFLDCGHIITRSHRDLKLHFNWQCPLCRRVKPFKHEAYVIYMRQVLNIKVLDTYVNLETPIRHQHLDCGHTFKNKPRVAVKRFECRTCTKESD